MKTTHIIGILVIAVAIILIITTAGDASQYLTFDQAKTQALEGSKSQVHVVGQLKKNVVGDVVGIETVSGAGQGVHQVVAGGLSGRVDVRRHSDQRCTRHQVDGKRHGGSNRGLRVAGGVIEVHRHRVGDGGVCGSAGVCQHREQGHTGNQCRPPE